VQPLNAGRIEPGPRGLPNAGQAVRKCEVLAYVVPSAAPIERSNQAAQLAELRAAKSLADKRVARLKELADTVPRKDIEAAESEAQSLAERIAAVGTGLASREALVAPVSGVIASAHVVAGQVVEARELVIEIVDPARLRVEALAFDAALAGNVGSASLAVGNQRVPLAFIGAARSLREQALPLGFRAEGKVLSSLAVGQPVRVFVQGKDKVQGIAVPVSSLMKNPANQTIVWVKTAPERFEPRTVTVEPLDGVNVAVTSGLKAGDRVATQGATLINQVR
ncbi:MAG: efflux RND transporter periplasmic adaptor subunit, partial [Betaproteobacteria bacterium]